MAGLLPEGSRDPGRILAGLVDRPKGPSFEEIEDARGCTGPVLKSGTREPRGKFLVLYSGSLLLGKATRCRERCILPSCAHPPASNPAESWPDTR